MYVSEMLLESDMQQHQHLHQTQQISPGSEKDQNGQSNTSANKQAKERTMLDLETKIRVLQDCRLYKQCKVAEMHNIHPTTVSKIIREKEAIIKQYQTEKQGVKPALNTRTGS
jgi:hypothetical protein